MLPAPVFCCIVSPKRQGYLRSESELHQTWVEDQGHKLQEVSATYNVNSVSGSTYEVESHHYANRPNSDERGDLPVMGHELAHRSDSGKDDHCCSLYYIRSEQCDRETGQLTMTMQKTKVNLNFFRMVGISAKNEVRFASLAVAPQLMSMLSIWHAMAWKTWIEMPPRKMVRSGSHLRFSRKQRKRFRPSTRYYSC